MLAVWGVLATLQTQQNERVPGSFRCTNYMVYFHPKAGASPPSFRHIPLSFFRIPLGLIERFVAAAEPPYSRGLSLAGRCPDRTAFDCLTPSPAASEPNNLPRPETCTSSRCTAVMYACFSSGLP